MPGRAELVAALVAGAAEALPAAAEEPTFAGVVALPDAAAGWSLCGSPLCAPPTALVSPAASDFVCAVAAGAVLAVSGRWVAMLVAAPARVPVCVCPDWMEAPAAELGDCAELCEPVAGLLDWIS